MNFDKSGAKHKIKTLFKSAFAFKLRSDQTQIAPQGWKISDVDDIEWLSEIFDQRVRITDSF